MLSTYEYKKYIYAFFFFVVFTPAHLPSTSATSPKLKVSKGLDAQQSVPTHSVLVSSNIITLSGENHCNLSESVNKQ